MPTSQQRREELSRLEEKATPGPWVTNETPCPGSTANGVFTSPADHEQPEIFVCSVKPRWDDGCAVGDEAIANCRFIAACREALPALLADLTAVEQRYRELFCAVWECPPDEFDDTKHDEAVEEAHRQCRENFRLRPVERENAELRERLA